MEIVFRSFQLDEYIPDFRAYFEKHPPQNNGEVQAIIEARTALKRSPTQVRKFLKRMGIKICKTGYVLGKSYKKKKQEEQEPK